MRPILALDLNFFLLNFVGALVGIFGPLYIFSLKGSFYLVALFYAVLAVAVLASSIPAGAFISRKGLGKGALFSGFTRAAHLFFLAAAPLNPLFFVTLSAIFGGITIALYWTTYHLVNIYEVRKRAWGKQISYLLMLATLGGLAGPAAGGVIIEKFGFTPLYAVAIVLVFFANFLLYIFHSQHKVPRLTFARIEKELPTKEFFYMILGYGGTRFMGMFAEILFPFLAFEITGGFQSLGFLVSASILISLVPLWYFGRLTDKGGVGRLLPFGAAAQAFLWVWRGLLRTPLDFLAVSAAGNLLGGSYSIPFDDLTYQLAKRGNPLSFLIKRKLAIWAGGLLGVPFIYLLFITPVSWLGKFLPAAILSFSPLILLKLYPGKQSFRQRIFPRKKEKLE